VHREIFEEETAMKGLISVSARGSLTLAAIAVVALVACEGWAQEKQKYAFKQPADAVGKYTQQLAVDVGDVPGHQVRVLELHTTYPTESPAYNGVKVKEGWLRAMSDYTDGSGHITGYGVALLENGDKIFSRYEGTTKTTVGADGAKTTRTDSVSTLIGGTGKFKGIRGTIRGFGFTDFKAASGATSEGEYWIEN
jgi:hypothetical protein